MSESTPLDPALAAEIDAWAQQDPDPATREDLADLRSRAESGDQAAMRELTAAFAGQLQFGTAGLRGPLGPGPARMNRVVVQRAAAGLAAWLTDRGLNQDGGRVIVGFDARHRSADFARDTADILAGAGFSPLLCDHPVPTPVVAFGSRHYDCVAGIVVTASHNPAADNGYKVYLGDGSQIVAPADQEIAECIQQVGSLDQIPRSSDFRTIGDDLIGAYVARAASLVPDDAPRDIAWVHTSMHGVGNDVVQRLTAACGFSAPVVVERQAEPDPDFPTVEFPNPEEPGALDLAVELASQQDVDLVIANDPDADRVAVAVPHSDRWRTLTGDELGALLGDDALRRGVEGVYATSIVSSTLLGTMAAAHGRDFRLTLTGFKWIGRVPGLGFGYEEAIGYCTDPYAVPDKDGITALLRILTLAASLKAEGKTLCDRLDDITGTYGLHATSQLAYRVSDVAQISDAMARLRANPPHRLAGQPVEVRDLREGTGDLPPTDAVEFTGERVHVVVRPSGTEPKLKCYLEFRLTPEESDRPDDARGHAAQAIARMRGELSSALGL